MRNAEKIEKIQSLILDINFNNECYGRDKDGFYFDYDSVIDLLEQTQQRINDSTRCPRPADLPEDMIWSEKPFNPDNYNYDPDDDGFDYIYDGSMSPEDWEKVVAAHENDMVKKAEHEASNISQW